MRVLTNLNSDVVFNSPILTLGTFDGVHLGHQKIISDLVGRAKELNRESVLFTFHPHPRMVLYPESHSVRLIDTVDEKIEKLRLLGLDTVILFPFTFDFSRLSAMEFIRDILVHQIGVSEMHVGHDHHFGKNREGNFNELQELGELYHFDVFQIPAVTVNTVSISSTKIRNAIAEGNMELAQAYLGRPFSFSGKVIHGNKMGRTIDFPTANLEIDSPEKIIPELGVYAVKVSFDSKIIHGVMNIGKKPTVQTSDYISVEVFLFDFNQDIYGKVLTVSVFDRLRGEQRFDSITDLKTQILKDAEMARIVLLRLPTV